MEGIERDQLDVAVELQINRKLDNATFKGMQHLTSHYAELVLEKEGRAYVIYLHGDEHGLGVSSKERK